MARKTADKPDENAQDDPTRCGGYVLTDHGWVLEPEVKESDDA